jgi:PAS domain S-box-containing protein
LLELAEHTNQILYVFTRDWRELLFVNDAYEDIWGRSADALAEEPRDFLEGIHPDHRGMVRDAMERMSAGESIEIEYPVNPKEDFGRWVRVQGEPIFDGTGEVVRVAGFATEITTEKRKERELERQTDLFEKAQDIADVGAWAYDVRTGETTLTDETYRIHGLPVDAELSPETSLDFYHPEDRPEVRRAFERAKGHGEAYDVEARLLSRDGQRWVRTRGDPQTEDGETVRIRGTIKDITEHKERERQLRRARDRLEALFEHSPDMVDVLDGNGEIVETNDRLCTELGYEEDELVGMGIWEIDRLLDESGVLEVLTELSVGERRRFEGRYERRDGSSFPVEVNLIGLDLDGEDRFVAIGRDIT